MSKLLTKGAERIAAEAVARAVAGGSLEILDSAGECLVKFVVASQYAFDPEAARIQFGAPAAQTVQKMGKPASFRLMSKDGAVCLMKGSAGRAGDLPIPVDRLFEGMRVTVGGLDYQLKFNEAEAAT